jgi:hypothetical protein
MQPTDHSHKTYGAVQIADLLQQKPRAYAVTWLCCGAQQTMTQDQVNHYANLVTLQCKACRTAGRPPIPPGPDRASVTVPGWGTVVPLTKLGHRYGTR